MQMLPMGPGPIQSDPCAMAKAFDPQHGQHRDGDWGSHCAGSSSVTIIELDDGKILTGKPYISW